MSLVWFNLEFAGRAYKLYDLSGPSVSIGSRVHFMVEEDGVVRRGRAILIREYHLRRRRHIVYVARLKNGGPPILLLIPMERETMETGWGWTTIRLLFYYFCF
jgi:hypothetical protein